MLQARQQRVRRQQLDARGRQLDGQGQPIQAPADLGHRRGIGGREGEVGLDGPCALEEEVDRGDLCQGCDVGTVCRVGQRQRRHGELMLAAHPQRRAAGDQRLQGGAGGQQVYQAGRWPTTVYPNWLQVGLTFLVPVAFAVTVPAEAITGRLTVTTLLEALAFTIILLLFSRWFWKRGLRHYSGASA